jgi:hypothetical protein
LGAKRADAFAEKMLPVIDGVRARGITTLQGIGDELRRLQWKKPRGGEDWSPTDVRNLLKRWAVSDCY